MPITFCSEVYFSGLMFCNETRNTSLKSFPEDLCSGFLRPEKNSSTSAGFEPRISRQTTQLFRVTFRSRVSNTVYYTALPRGNFTYSTILNYPPIGAKHIFVKSKLYAIWKFQKILWVINAINRPCSEENYQIVNLLTVTWNICHLYIPFSNPKDHFIFLLSFMECDIYSLW